MDSYERVHEYLSRLGVTTLENIIDSYPGTLHDKATIEVRNHLLSEELMHKLPNKTENALNLSGFPFRKTMDDFDFDFSFQASIDLLLMILWQWGSCTTLRMLYYWHR